MVYVLSGTLLNHYLLFFISYIARVLQWSEHQLLWRWILIRPRQWGMFHQDVCVKFDPVMCVK